MNNENLSSDENLADDIIVDRSCNGHLKLGKKLYLYLYQRWSL